MKRGELTNDESAKGSDDTKRVAQKRAQKGRRGGWQ